MSARADLGQSATLAPRAAATLPLPGELANPASARQGLPSRCHVLVVGAGFAGLSAVIGLKRAGFDDVVVIERGHDVGGTWRDNTYPGAACDVPSQLYSFSFALNRDWSSSYSRQPEIQRYLQRVSDDLGVRDHIYLGVDMLSARWIDSNAEWEVTTSTGTVHANLLVLGIGALCEPRLPDIAGLDCFAGPVFHSSRWNHAVDLSGKRVAVIGTGASAIQIVPQLARIARQLDVYQRTPPWILPRNDHRYGPISRFAIRHVPGFQRLMRAVVYWWLELRVVGFVKRPNLLRRGQQLALAHMRRSVTDPELRRKLTPDYTMGCKRILISNDYYPAISKSNTELVTDRIAEITSDSIVTTDGRRRAVDALVVATGFFATDNPTARRLIGKSGTTLAQLWERNGMKAYKGITVADFPNMFYLLGPNTGLGHSSMVQMAEAQTTYLVDAVRTMTRFDLATVEVRHDVYQRYGQQMQAQLQGTVWTTGHCASWYQDKHGTNTTLWPGFTFHFRRLTQRFDLDRYHSTARASREHAT